VPIADAQSGAVVWQDTLDLGVFDTATAVAADADQVYAAGWVRQPGTSDNLLVTAYDARQGGRLWTDVSDIARRRDMASKTFRMHPGDLLAGDGDHVAVLTDGTAVIGGQEHRWSTVGLYRFRGEQVAACWLLPLTQRHSTKSGDRHEAQQRRTRSARLANRRAGAGLPARGRLGPPAEGGPDDFLALLEVIGSIDPAHGDSAATRLLFRCAAASAMRAAGTATAAIPIPGDHETSLRTRLPDDLRGTANGPARELQVHLPHRRRMGRRDVQPDRPRRDAPRLGRPGRRHLPGRLAVYVKPRGRFGAGYMAAIAPFRHHIVYPAMLRQIARAWDARATPRDA
jgi:hypothetical protein